MANYKVVDADQLNADLTSVADAIRERGGTSDQMVFPEGFVSAVDGIPDYSGQVIDGSIEHYSNKTIKTMRNYAFQMCLSLKSIELPELTDPGWYAFQRCEALETAIVPKIQKAYSHCFAVCSKLKTLDFHNLQAMYDNAFAYCGIKNLILRRTDGLATLDATSALSNNPIANGTGYIYVPRSLVDSYKNATNWSVYANQFRALEDYTVDGTTTGELDESKI